MLGHAKQNNYVVPGTVRAVALGALPRGGYRPRGKRYRQLYIVQGLPGVGPRRARQLLDRFGSVEGVMTASVGELCAMSGIGKQIAEKIRWAVEEPRCEYATVGLRGAVI